MFCTFLHGYYSYRRVKPKEGELGLVQIVGIDPGASLMEMSRTAFDKYGLNYELVDSSGRAIMSELRKAYAKKELIIVTLWYLHWAFVECDLTYLDLHLPI